VAKLFANELSKRMRRIDETDDFRVMTECDIKVKERVRVERVTTVF